MTIDIPDELIVRLGAEIARHLQPTPDLELLSVKALSDETGISEDTLRNACRSYEQGSDDGLRCTRDTPGVENSKLRVARGWYLQWRERTADRTQIRQPIRLGKAAA